MNNITDPKQYYPAIGLKELNTLCTEIGRLLPISPIGSANQYLSKSINSVMFKIEIADSRQPNELDISVVIENTEFMKRQPWVVDGKPMTKSFIRASLTITKEHHQLHWYEELFDLLTKNWVLSWVSLKIDSIETFDINEVKQYLPGSEVTFSSGPHFYDLSLSRDGALLFEVHRETVVHGLVKHFKRDVLDMLSLGISVQSPEQKVYLSERVNIPGVNMKR
ncbi:MAG: hypothetical protein ACRCVV_10565 [Shewanella sp.]